MEKEWDLIADITTEEDMKSIEFPLDKTKKYKEILFEFNGHYTGPSTRNQRIQIGTNDNSGASMVCYLNALTKDSGTKYNHSGVISVENKEIVCTFYKYTNAAIGGALNKSKMANEQQVDCFNKWFFGFTEEEYLIKAGFNCIVYAR